MNKRLWQFGRKMPVENKFQAVLKLELLRKSLGDWEKIDEDEHKKMCRKCHIPWNDGFFTVEVIPSCKRSRMQLEKLQSIDVLTKQQESLIKYLKTRTGRVAKYTCQVCSYKTRIPLESKIREPKASTAAAAGSEEGAEFQDIYNRWLKETKRKSRRDKNEKAGLKIPPKPSAINQNNKSDLKKEKAALKIRSTPPSNNKPNIKSGNVGSSGSNSRYTPTDFKLIQKRLKNSLSGEADAKAKEKPKANQPVGKLRYSRS